MEMSDMHALSVAEDLPPEKDLLFCRPSAPASMLRHGSGTGAIFSRSTVIARRWPSPLRLWCVKLRSKSRSLDLRIASGA